MNLSCLESEEELGCIFLGSHKIDRQLPLMCLPPIRYISVKATCRVYGIMWLTSRNRKAFPSPASGAKARKLVTSSAVGVMVIRMCIPTNISKG